jgi:hypothetical protein
MNKKILLIATALLGATALYAQDSESHMPINLGFKVGFL